METEKKIAMGVDIFVGVVIFISLLTADWEWLLGDEGGAILILVISLYVAFIGAAIGVSFWAFAIKRTTSDPTTLIKTEQPRLTPLKVTLLICVLLSALLSVITVIFYEPGEGVLNYTIATIFAIIAVILAIINAIKTRK